MGRVCYNGGSSGGKYLNGSSDSFPCVYVCMLILTGAGLEFIVRKARKHQSQVRLLLPALDLVRTSTGGSE